jgi:hypothetical protein
MSTPGIAVPGTVVPSASLISPGGSQGIQGLTGPQGIPWQGFIAKTAAYTLTTGDNGKYVICSGGSWTLTLPAPAIGLAFQLRNDMGIVYGSVTGTITIAPTGGTIDGAASLALLPQQECTVFTDGTNWRTFGLKRIVVLGTQDITVAAPSAQFLLPLGYRMFELEFDAIMGSAFTGFNAVFSMDGGATWANTGQYYWVYGLNSNQTTWVASGSSSQNYALFGFLAIVASYCKVHVKLFPGSPNAGAGGGVLNPGYIAEAGDYQSGAGGPQRTVLYGSANLLRINALQYYAGSGNITNSCLTVKGIV